MDEPEIILNLWYIYDDTGTIYSLRARAYVGIGTDEEKLSLLRRFAPIDYLIAQPFPIPERIHTTFHRSGGEQKELPVAHVSGLVVLGQLELFEDALVELEKQLPAQTTLTIGQKPLVCITPLYADDQDRLHPMTKESTYLNPDR